MSEQEAGKIVLFRGKAVEEMTREELIEVVHELGRQLYKLREANGHYWLDPDGGDGS